MRLGVKPEGALVCKSNLVCLQEFPLFSPKLLLRHKVDADFPEGEDHNPEESGCEQTIGGEG